MSDPRFIATAAERIWSAAAGIVAVRRGLHLSPAARTRAIHLIEGDLDCLVGGATDREVSEQAVEEMLRNRELLLWLRGGPLPGNEAFELLEDNVAIFYRESAEVEQANGDALRTTPRRACSCPGRGGGA